MYVTVKLYREIARSESEDGSLTREGAAQLRRELEKLPRVAPPSNRELSDRGKENWVGAGGWFDRQADLTIRYRPMGHADPFLRAWTDLAAEVYPPEEEPSLPDARPVKQRAAQSVFRELSKKKSPGSCMKCHAAERVASRDGDPLRVSWVSFRASMSAHPATRFDHRPHFSLGEEKRCLGCHQINPDADFEAGFEGFQATSGFASGFLPMQKQTCARCHNGGAAGDACLLCHDYHLGDFVSAYLEP